MALQIARGSPARVKSTAVVAVATVTLFLEKVTRSYQYALREGSGATARTAVDWVVGVSGPYLLVPGLLVVAYYLTSGVGPKLVLTGRVLLGLFVGTLAGSLLGQYVGGTPHPLVFLLGSETFAADPVIVRLWVDVFGSIGRDYLAVVGGLVLARAALAAAR